MSPAKRSLRIKEATEKDSGTHLGVPQHNHPDQDHVDVDSQRLVMVNLIHLRCRGTNNTFKESEI